MRAVVFISVGYNDILGIPVHEMAATIKMILDFIW